MALNIKDAETDRLFRQYARKHSTSFTGAIKLAVGNAPRQEGEVVEETDDERVALLRFDGRPARLNYGDCMAYALAKAHGVPLLYKGGAFASTDIRPALAG